MKMRSSIWSLRVFPLVTKVPLIHPIEVKCDKLTYAMIVLFIVLDLKETRQSKGVIP